MQQLFSLHHGTHLLPFALSGTDAAKGLYASVVLDEPSQEIVIKLVNGAAAARKVHLQLAGGRSWAAQGQAVVLASDELKAENSLDQPTRVAPVTRKLRKIRKDFAPEAPPWSLTVLRLKADSDR